MASANEGVATVTGESAGIVAEIARGLRRAADVGSHAMKVSIGAVLAVVVLTGIACERDDTPPQRVRIAYHHPMVTLDPHAHNDSVTGSVLSAVYDSLVGVQPGQHVQPRLAVRWTTPSDTVWRFWIRDGVRFHDGRVLAVDDVLFSLRRARFGEGSAMATYLEPVTDIRPSPADPLSFEIETREAFPLLLHRLDLVAIVPRDFDPSHPIGTGVLKWYAGSVHGPVLLRRFDDCWLPWPSGIGEVEIQFIETEEELARAIHERDVDVVASVTEAFRLTHPPLAGWHEVPTPSNATAMLSLNLDSQTLMRPTVREAIDLAIDRKALIQSAFPSGGVEPATGLVPAEVLGFGSRSDRDTSDPTRARRLVAAAGLSSDVTVEMTDANIFPPVRTFLVDALSSIGLRVVVQNLPYNELYHRLAEGGCEMVVFSWNFRTGDPAEFLEAMAHSRDPERSLGSLNSAELSDPQLDLWIEQAAHEAVSVHRLQLLTAALERVERSRAYLPLYYRSRIALVRDGFVVTPQSGSWVRPQEIAVAR